MSEQIFGKGRTPSAEEIAAHQAEPIPWADGVADPHALKLGLKGQAIDFSWKPYEKRSPAARADYDRLRESIEKQGITAHVIVWCGHVIIGMRRVELARELGVKSVRIAEVLEDVRLWWKYDLPRLDALKHELGEVPY